MVKIDFQSILACFTHRVLQIRTVKIGFNGMHKQHTIKILCKAILLLRKSRKKILSIPIEPILEQFDLSLGSVSGWDGKGIAYENLQARIRGTILMSLSNKSDALALTSSNKSETAVGYATLYGDTASGFAVIKDVFKTVVYKLARHINKIMGREVIPVSVLTRAPSAELKEVRKIPIRCRIICSMRF
jgi:NAD+ synthase (glutamine-hydrolysing)